MFLWLQFRLLGVSLALPLVIEQPVLSCLALLEAIFTS